MGARYYDKQSDKITLGIDILKRLSYRKQMFSSGFRRKFDQGCADPDHFIRNLEHSIRLSICQAVTQASRVVDPDYFDTDDIYKRRKQGSEYAADNRMKYIRIRYSFLY